jgi:uncharacterized protein YmfQ (DUF2313 family)
MGVAIQNPEQYEKSLRCLFPQGDYWDKQFADPDSDCSLFCKAKIEQLVRLRKRMSDLQDESMVSTANETLEDWERVLLGAANTGLDTAQRKNFLIEANTGNVNINIIKEIGKMYGITITDITFPFRPAFFGHSFFGANRITSPAGFSVLFIYVSRTNELQDDFEKHIISTVLSNYIVYFIYGGS